MDCGRKGRALVLLPEVTIRFDGEDYYYNDSYTAKVRLRKGTRRTKLAADINVSGKSPPSQ